MKLRVTSVSVDTKEVREIVYSVTCKNDLKKALKHMVKRIIKFGKYDNLFKMEHHLEWLPTGKE